MQKFASLKLMPILFLGVLTLSMSGCSNPELQKCLDQASLLWDNTTNDKNANHAYWTAVDRCKEKYE